jgi:hypothetical protein
MEKLHLFVPPGERNFALFGPVTRKLVKDIQRDHFHPSRVTGIVDQATVNLIREAATQSR